MYKDRANLIFRYFLHIQDKNDACIINIQLDFLKSLNKLRIHFREKIHPKLDAI
jgi:hypothetical protein